MKTAAKDWVTDFYIYTAYNLHLHATAQHFFYFLSACQRVKTFFFLALDFIPSFFDTYLHSIPSYKKRWEILTSCVSYFPAVFIQTLFLNFSPVLNSRFLFLPQFLWLSMILSIRHENCINYKCFFLNLRNSFLMVWISTTYCFLALKNWTSCFL